jgi:hypothetical protein
MNRSVASALLLVIAIASPACAAAGQAATATKAPKAAASKPAASKPAVPNKVENVKRLQPSEVAGQIPDLPPEFVEKLNTRGCTIPQFDSGEGTDVAAATPTNVIEGEFARKGQKDWAALCSNGKTSTIVIFWSKPTSCPASLARLDDAHYLKPAANSGKNKTLHYSRSIRALGEGDLDDPRGAMLFQGNSVTHQGIDDRFVGKSSAFFYCNDGKWKIFPAKDS